MKDNNVLVFPCNIGDTVYTNMSWNGDYERSKNKPYEHTIVFIGINGERNFFNTVNKKTGRMFSFLFSDINKMVYLNKKDAEINHMGNKETLNESN